MNNKKKATLKNRWIELCLICVTMIVMTYMIVDGIRQNIDWSPNDISVVGRGWYYLEDNRKVSVSLPTVIEKKEGESLILYNDSFMKTEEGKTLTTRGAEYNLKISFDGQIIYAYSDNKFPRNAQMKSKLDCEVVVPTGAGEGTWSFEYQNTHHGVYKINRIYIGTEKAVFQKHWKASVLPLMISFLMLVMAFLAAGVELYLYHLHLGDRRFLNMVAFLVICSIWCVTDSGVFQQMGDNYQIVCIISFYAFMLMSIPMLHFVKNTGNIKKYKVIDGVIIAFYLNAIIQGILNVMGIFEFIDMLFVTHFILIVGIVIVSMLLYREYKADPTREIRFVSLAFLFMAACGLLALLLYWILEISYYSLIFQLGILIFVFILMSIIVLNMADNFRYKAEMIVYQRLAMEDRLTGIGNRRAFDEKVYELMINADQYDDIALIFMDLNGLKNINDTYGHNAGDEMIIASANCIKNTFDELGYCYRIGGDEFCVVIPNPSGNQTAWFDKMDREISIYNNRSRYKISIARGISYLKDNTGNLKTISDWKYEADQKMYQNKTGRTQV